jgi:hypothetical protein
MAAYAGLLVGVVIRRNRVYRANTDAAPAGRADGSIYDRRGFGHLSGNVDVRAISG